MDKATGKQEEKKFFGELTLSLVVKSEMEESLFQSRLSDDSLVPRIVLKDGVGNYHETEVLDVQAYWEEFDDVF